MLCECFQCICTLEEESVLIPLLSKHIPLPYHDFENILKTLKLFVSVFCKLGYIFNTRIFNIQMESSKTPCSVRHELVIPFYWFGVFFAYLSYFSLILGFIFLLDFFIRYLWFPKLTECPMTATILKARF
jgi:hypothetical protein